MRWTHLLGRLAVASAIGAATLAGLVSGPADAAARCHTPWGSSSEQAPTTHVDASVSESRNARLTGLRSARHRCFDRLVLDFDGRGVGFQVGYVAEVTEDGSGQVVPLAGGASLQILVGAPAYDDSYTPTYRPADEAQLLPLAGYRSFRQVAWAGSFEGQTTLGLGVRARLPFRVLALDGPGEGSRLVIDVAHRWSTHPGPGADAGPPTPGLSPGTGTGPCDVLKSPVTLTSVTQVEKLLVGSWIRCSSESALGPAATAEVGFEVAGGRFYRLYQGSGGTLIRAEGADQEGVVSVMIDTNQVNSPGFVNFEVLGTGTMMTHPVFFNEPEALRLTGMAGTGDYQRWSGPPPTPGVPPKTEPQVPTRRQDHGPSHSRCHRETSESTNSAERSAHALR